MWPIAITRGRIIAAIAATVLILLCITLLVILSNMKTPSSPPDDALFRNAALSIEDRITDLLSYMTLEEKVGQMALVQKDSVKNIEDVKTYGLGAILSGAGAKPELNTREGWSAMVQTFVDAGAESRLGIPILYGVDAIHGHGNVPGATIFPHAIGLGASGDEDLVRRIAVATGEEMRATGIRWNYAPMLDMPKDIRWGRTYEGFSDDPELVKKLGVAYVEGLQGAGENISVLATPKHFVGVGGMLWGTSSGKDYKIDQGRIQPDESVLRSEYLPPFEAVVSAGAKSIMVGLASWGDVKLAAEPYLLTEVLKQELGFDGFVVSDWYGVYEISRSKYQATIKAINAGVDMVMLPFEYNKFVGDVVYAVKKGEISEDRIDDAVRRILRAKFALGLFDSPLIETATDNFASMEHKLLAREAVAKSLVLLKNESEVLPIATSTKLIRVAGSSADNTGRQSGAWTIDWQGVDGNVVLGATSILAGIREVAGADTRVEYNINGHFNGTERAEIGIAVVGEDSYAEGWGDKADPTLSPADLGTIKRLQRVSDKVLVILVTGRPLIITNDLGTWDALVVAWLPGSEGAGVADVLFGRKPFTGTLPLAWPKSINSSVATFPDASPESVLFPRYFGFID